ncbi:MAG: Gfo/Idh/MocA family protein [Pirellulales bacterium]
MSASLPRREFLLGSLAVAGGAHLLRGRASAAEEATSTDSLGSRRCSANDQLAIAVMGTNGRGHALALAFAKQPGVEVATICDVDSEVAARTVAALSSERGQQAKAEGDFRRVLDDPAIDALVIAAPDHWHAPATVLACQAGKHVYVEKPACHNPREGELMVAAAVKYDRQVQLGTQRRSSPEIRQAIERVHAGDLGRVRMARSWITSIRPSIGHGRAVDPPARLDYEFWQGPAPREPYRDNVIHYHWHWFWNWGTGELGNNGIHGLDLCRWGMQVDCPREVVCGGGKVYFDDDQQTPDTELATFRYGEPGHDERLIHWEHRTWHRHGGRGRDFGVEFYGDEGTLTLDGSSYEILDRDGKQVSQVKLTGGEPEHLANFCAAIRSGDALQAPIDEGVSSTLLCHLGNIAYRTGRTVNLDSATKQLADDRGSDQQALWSREYAPGWEVKI